MSNRNPVYDLPTVDMRQLAAILAGLRALKAFRAHGPMVPNWLWDIETDHGTFAALSDEGLSALADTLQFGSLPEGGKSL